MTSTSVDFHPTDVLQDADGSLLVVDTGTWSQLPGLKEHVDRFAKPKLVIDHHLTQEGWADTKLVLTQAAAAGEIVAELAHRWGIRIDKPLATAIYLAVASDTGWFQFSSVSGLVSVSSQPPLRGSPARGGT